MNINTKTHSPEPIQPDWGHKGHGLVHEVAAENLPEEVPDFFVAGKDRMVGLASQPDRWKDRSLNYLRGATSIDHFMAYEQVEGRELPPDRFDFLAMVSEQGLEVPGLPAKYVGLLPYRVAELYQNLTLDFALWRNEGMSLPSDDPKRKALEENALVTAGLLGHYVGDAAQPLHATVHHDGWNVAAEANPHGYRTRRGLHREFETHFANAVADEQEVSRRLHPAKLLQGDPLAWGMGLVAESNSQVEHLYELEKEGQFRRWFPSEEGVSFLHDRVAVGAENLRDLWYTAWHNSESLARRIRRPD